MSRMTTVSEEALSCRLGRFQAIALLLRTGRRWLRGFGFVDRRLHPLHCAAQVGNETLFRLMLNVYPAGLTHSFSCICVRTQFCRRSADHAVYSCTPLYVAAARGYAALVPTMLDVMGERLIVESIASDIEEDDIGAAILAAVQFGARCNGTTRFGCKDISDGGFETATVMLEASYPVVGRSDGISSETEPDNSDWRCGETKQIRRYCHHENHLPRALYTAVEHNQVQLIQLLLRRFPEAVRGYGKRSGGRFSDRDCETPEVCFVFTPLDCAIKAGHVEAMAALLAHDPLMASMNLPDGKPKPVGEVMHEAMRTALEYGQLGIVKLLLQHQPYLDHLPEQRRQQMSQATYQPLMVPLDFILDDDVMLLQQHLTDVGHLRHRVGANDRPERYGRQWE